MRRAFFILVVSYLACSCATLTKSQIESVNQFGRMTENFSAFPGRIMAELADIRKCREVYYANSLSIPQNHIDILDSIHYNKVHGNALSEKADITFRIIDNYSDALSLLSSDKYINELKNHSENLGEDLDTLISHYNRIDKSARLPLGIGAAAGKFIQIGGRQFIRCRQAKEIKKYIPQADTLIAVMTGNLITFLKSGNIDQLIDAEERGLNTDYLSFISHSSKTSIANDFEYLDLKERIEQVKQLRSMTISATNSIRKAHGKMLGSIEKRRNLKEIVEGFREMAVQIRDLNTTVGKIDFKHK